MDTLETILNGIRHAERLMLVKHRNNPHWRHTKSKMILAASHASLALHTEDQDNLGAHVGSLEEFLCLEEPTSGRNTSKTLEESLNMPPLSISKNSTAKTSDDSSTL